MLGHYASVSDFAFVRDGDLENISQPLDFLGVNYYFRHHVRETAGGSRPEYRRAFLGPGRDDRLPRARRRPAMGWPVEADGLPRS